MRIPQFAPIYRLFPTIALLLFTPVAPTSAQAPRHGAWSDMLGLGFGTASFSCDTCSSSPFLGGWTMSFAAGGTFNPHLRLGAEYRGWMNGFKRGEKLPGIDLVSLVLSYYPRPRGGPFGLIGAGLSHYAVCTGTGNPIEPCTRDPSYYAGWGWGLTLGAGWEIRTSAADGRMALRPILAFHHGGIRRLRSDSGATVATGWNQNLITLELRVLFNLVPR